jgi:hypothetical protein
VTNCSDVAGYADRPVLRRSESQNSCRVPRVAPVTSLGEPLGRGGGRGLDDCFTRDMTRNIGAEIMGRNKFGPQRGPWEDHEWKGLVRR